MLKTPTCSQFSYIDVLILIIVAALLYTVISFAQEWNASFQPYFALDLSYRYLPIYTLYSGLRGLIALLLSVIFSIIVGYGAAKSYTAEKWIIPLLDIGQSIPVLGFLPGLVLALITLFPRTNTGLELASILMIFTSQVWNITFSVYNSIKSLPKEWQEASYLMSLSPWKRFVSIELPFASIDLTWNCMLSMSGGWFFLCVCEAFTLKDQHYRLPGIGAYMASAIEKNHPKAMLGAIIAMSSLILFMDFLLWRPILAWLHRYRLEDIPGGTPPDSNFKYFVQHSQLLIWIHRLAKVIKTRRPLVKTPPYARFLSNARLLYRVAQPRVLKPLGKSILLILALWTVHTTINLGFYLAQVSMQNWIKLLGATSTTFLRVSISIILSTLWTVPVGIWIGTSTKYLRLLQTIIQFLSAFPSPMLYPIVVAFIFNLGFSFNMASVILMMLGVQWYILFNTLAGALRVPAELQLAARLMNLTKWQMWTRLYLPSVFPAVVTGWVTAAGGAWNASIVAEYMTYQGQILTTHGIGSLMNIATETADFPTLAASLCLVIVIVIFINRTIWRRLYKLAQSRFRLDF